MALKVNHPPSGTPTGRRPTVHYRGGKRIDTTQANRFPKPESLRDVGHANSLDMAIHPFSKHGQEIRELVRWELRWLEHGRNLK